MNWRRKHFFAGLFSEVLKRNDILPNMEKLEDASEIYQTVLENLSTIVQHEIYGGQTNEQGGQAYRTFTEQGSSLVISSSANCISDFYYLDFSEIEYTICSIEFLIPI